MTLNLYEQADALDQAMASIDQWIAEHEEEIKANGGEIPKEITAEYDALMRQQKDSVAWHAKKIQEYEAQAEMVGKEISRLESREGALERKAEWRKRMLFEYLQREGLTEVKHPLVTVKIKLNPPKVIHPMWSQLELGQLWASPKYEWCVVRKEPEYRLNLNEIKTAVAHPEQVGAHAIPEGVTIVQEQSLSIR